MVDVCIKQGANDYCPIIDIRAIIFNKDGTILNHNLYWGEITRRWAWELTEMFRLTHDEYKTLHASMKQVGACSHKETMWAIRKHLHGLGVEISGFILDETCKKIQSEALSDMSSFAKIFPEVLPFLIAAHRSGVCMGVITNDCRESTEYFINVNGLSSFFSFVFTHEDFSSAKETGMPAMQMLRDMGVDPLSAIVIGDSKIDMQMAVTANMATGIAVSTGITPYEELQKSTPYVVRSLAELRIL